MIEAEIECLINEYTIEDLGMLLRRGQVAYRSEKQARASRELKIAHESGAVSVRWVERSRVSKPVRPLPPSVRMSRPNKGGKGKGVPSHVDTTTTNTKAATDAAVKAVQEAAREAVQEATREVAAREAAAREAAKGMHAENAGLKSELAEIKGLLQHLVASGGAVQTAPGVQAPGARKSASSEPLFIPTGIVDHAKALHIQAEEGSSSANLDEAVAALKASKGATRKRRPKNTEETD